MGTPHTLRSTPEWFDLNDYNYLNTITPLQWHAELSIRRQSKSLFDLIKKEPEIFLEKFSSNFFWANFSDTLSSNKSKGTPSPSKYSFGTYPKSILSYLEYRILPLFDLTHWHEIHDHTLPSNKELELWLFPHADNLTRYLASDAKKLLKRAMLECDAFKNWK